MSSSKAAPPPPPPPPGAGGIKAIRKPSAPRPPSIKFDLKAMEPVALAALKGCYAFDPMKRRTTMLRAFPEMLNRLLVPPGPKDASPSNDFESSCKYIWDNHFTEVGRKPVEGLFLALSYALLPLALTGAAKSKDDQMYLKRLFVDPGSETWDMLFGPVPEDLSKIKAPEWAAAVAPIVERIAADEINWKSHVLPTLSKAFPYVAEIRAQSTGWSRLKPEPVLTADAVSGFKALSSFRIRHHHNLTALPDKWPSSTLKEIDLTSQAVHSGKPLSKKVQLPAALAMATSAEYLEGAITDPSGPADAAEWRSLRLPKDSKLKHLGIALLTNSPAANFPTELLSKSPATLTSLSLSKNSWETAPGCTAGVEAIADRLTYLRLVDWYTPGPAKPLKWNAFKSLKQLHLLATEPFEGQLLPVESYALLPPTVEVLRCTFLPSQSKSSLSDYIEKGVSKLPNLASLSLQGLDMAMGFKQDISSAALTAGKNWSQTMTRLSLGVMYIRSIGDGLVTLRNLQTLELLGNKLRAIPPAVPALPNLAHLVIENNALFELPRAMALAKNLTTLRAADNRLRVVKGLPPNLRSVDFTNNSLQHLPVHADVWGSIENLTIQRNQLTSLPATLIHKIPRTANLDMRRNRFGHLAVDPVRMPEGRRRRILSLKESAANVALRKGISSIRASGIPDDLVDWVDVNSLKCYCGKPECAFLGLVPRYAVIKSQSFVLRSQILGGKTTGVPVVVQFNPAHFSQETMRVAANALAPTPWAPVHSEDIIPLLEEEVDPEILKDELRAQVERNNKRVEGKDFWAEAPKAADDDDNDGGSMWGTPLPDVEDPWTLLQ